MKKEPTIIHYIDNFHIGGAQSMLMELFYSINKYSSYEQIVYCKHSSKITRLNAKLAYGIKVIRLKSEDFVKHIVSKKPCVLIYHKLLRSDTGIYEKLYNTVPLIVVNHTFTKPSFKIKIHRCNYIISVCKSMLIGMQKHKKRCRGKMVWIRNGINFDRYNNINPIKNEYDRNKILVTGRINTLNKWKYSDNWIKWCSAVKLPKKMVHEYIGEGYFFSHAKKFYSGLKNKRNEIKFKGFITEHEKKVSIIKGWDVFLYRINEQEGLSVSVLEALACGVPVICSNHYGNKEIIVNGVNGYVFKKKEEAREILQDLCKDRERLNKLKKTTREHFVDNLDAKHMSKKYLSLIEDLYNARKW